MPLVYPTAFFGQAQTLTSALRFNGTNQRMQRTATATSSNRDDQSFSFWFRVPTLGVFNPIFSVDNGSGGEFIAIDSDDMLWWRALLGNGVTQYRSVKAATPVQADTWHHCFVLLSAGLDAVDREQIWLDGVRVSSGSYTGTATVFGFDTLVHSLGYEQNSGAFFEGDLALFHWVDGAVMASSDFADVIDGIYQAKEVTPVYDVNGSFLNFANPSNLGADADNGHTYSVSNLTSADLIGDGPPSSY